MLLHDSISRNDIMSWHDIMLRRDIKSFHYMIMMSCHFMISFLARSIDFPGCWGRTRDRTPNRQDRMSYIMVLMCIVRFFSLRPHVFHCHRPCWKSPREESGRSANSWRSMLTFCLEFHSSSWWSCGRTLKIYWNPYSILYSLYFIIHTLCSIL